MDHGVRRTRVADRLDGLGVDALLVTVVVYLATLGFIYISVPLGVAVVGSIGFALHRRSVAAEQLSEFNRRHARLPTATARPS